MGRFADAAERWRQAPRIPGDEYWLPIELLDSIETLDDFVEFLEFFADGLSKDGFKTDIDYADDLLSGLALMLQLDKFCRTGVGTYVDYDLSKKTRHAKSQYAIVANGLFTLMAQSNDRTD